MLPDNGTIVFESIANIHKGKYYIITYIHILIYLKEIK